MYRDQLPADIWRIVNDIEHAELRAHPSVTLSLADAKILRQWLETEYKYDEGELEDAQREISSLEEDLRMYELTNEDLNEENETLKSENAKYKSAYTKMQAIFDDIDR